MAGAHNGQSMGLGGQVVQDVNSSTEAQAVGQQFVEQYYDVMKNQPHLLHRFYTDHSTVTYCEPDVPAQVIGTQRNIHEKVMSLNYHDADATILSVDAQYSLQRGVIVQVTGSLQTQGGPKREFVQTFFLAVQTKGYFVLNDVFRILPEAQQPPPPPPQLSAFSSAPSGPQENGYPPAPQHLAHPPQLNGQGGYYQQPQPPHQLHQPPPQLQAPLHHQHTPQQPPPQPQQAPPPLPPQHQPQQQPQQTPQPQQAPQQQQQPAPQAPPPPAPPAANPSPPPQQAPQSAEEAPPPAPPAEVATPEPPRAEEAAAEPEKASEPETEPESEVPAARPSWAERLKQGSKAAPPRPAAPRPAPKAPAPEDAPPAAQGNGTSGPPPAQQHSSFPEEPTGCSIFVKDLPAGCTAERLTQAFAEIGPLAASGSRPAVQFKVQKDKPSFAFIDFADAASAEAAIKGPVVIDGHTVKVDEKKPLYMTRPQGRGGRFDGGRFGGRFEGGRGMGRGYEGRGRGPLVGGPGGRGPPGGRGDMMGGRNGGYPSADGGRGRAPPGGGRGGRGRGPPPNGTAPNGNGGRGGRGPATAAPAADAAPAAPPAAAGAASAQ